MTDVIIIGAGAAGLMCAAGAAGRGKSVLVIDHNPAPGIKLRATGGGRCNFSNTEMGPDHYASQNPHFVKSALARFTPAEIIAMLNERGIRWQEREMGRLFCMDSANDIAVMLRENAQSAGAKFMMECEVREALKDGNRFLVRTMRNGEIEGRSLVIATGGLSYAQLGASPLGLDIARSFGLEVIRARPALVPFVLSKADRALWGTLAGISQRVRISTCDGHEVQDDLLFTHRGLSGPAGLRASLWWNDGEPLLIDFLPTVDALGLIMERRGSAIELKNLIGRHMPQRLADLLARLCEAERPLRQISEREIGRIAERLSHWELHPAGTEGWDKAEVMRGGVDTRALSSKDMSVRELPGLYFIGEVMDVTGDLGGYNLHWAWASAHAASASV